MATHLATIEDAFTYLNRIIRITNMNKGHAPGLNNTVLIIWSSLNQYADLNKLFAYTSSNCSEKFGKSLWFTSKQTGKEYYIGYNSSTGQIDIRQNMQVGSTLLSVNDNILDEPSLKNFFKTL